MPHAAQSSALVEEHAEVLEDFLGVYASLSALQTAHPTSAPGDRATVSGGVPVEYYWSEEANAWTTGLSALALNYYRIAVARVSGDFSFFQDPYVIFRIQSNQLRAISVGSARNMALYGMAGTSAGAAWPFEVDVGAFYTRSGKGSVVTGAGTVISAVSLAPDYDNLVIGWLSIQNVPHLYRITIMGNGTDRTAIIERWNLGALSVNQLVTFP